jgi:hypothetical protein
MRKTRDLPSQLGIATAAVLAATGTYWAFTRGGGDFAVFHHAWALVASGRGSEIYTNNPDRFLYAPGFAWALAPLGWLPRSYALALWCLWKAWVLAWILRAYGRELTRGTAKAGAAALGVLIVAKPLLIDFQYGQVNLLIAGACTWALLGHFSAGHEESGSGASGSRWDVVRWGLLSMAAFGKVYPLALLAVPFIVTQGIPAERLRRERIGLVAGLLLMFMLPLFTEGFAGTWELMTSWRTALLSRGLPLESHNQSFSALIHHYFSGIPTSVLSLGGAIELGQSVFSLETITWLTLAWTFLGLGMTAGWLVAGSNHPPLRWSAVAIGLLIVPSHLVWKPYFVMGLPLAILAAHRAGRRWQEGSRLSMATLALIFVGINLTGFDFVGLRMGAHFEAASILLLMHLGLIAIVLREA